MAPVDCPLHLEMDATALTVGVGLMVISWEAVVVPHSLVTARFMLGEPGVLNIIVPGVCWFDVDGVPPGKVHR